MPSPYGQMMSPRKVMAGGMDQGSHGVMPKGVVTKGASSIPPMTTGFKSGKRIT